MNVFSELLYIVNNVQTQQHILPYPGAPFPNQGFGPGVPPSTMFLDGAIRIGNMTISAVDLTLLVCCPICAALGVIVSFFLKNREKNKNQAFLKRLFMGAFSNIGLLFSGMVLGLVVALFFVGAINNEPTSLARVLALTILLGFQAPKVWFSQERVINNIIDDKIKNIIKEANQGSRKSGT